MLKKEEYIKTVKRPYPPLLASLVFAGCNSKEAFSAFLNPVKFLKNIVLSDSDWHYSKIDIENMRGSIFNLWLNEIELHNAVKILEEREKKFIEVSESPNSFLNEFILAFENYMPALILVWQCDQPVAEKIKELILKKLPQKEAEQLISDLNIPEKDNYYKKEEYELFLCKSDKEIREHAKKYEWIHSRYGEMHPYTFEEAKEKLSKTNKEAFFNKWNEDKEHLKSRIQYAKKILGKEAHIVDLMQFIIYYRTQRTDTIYKAVYSFIPKLKEIAKSHNLTYQELLYCTKSEILSTLPSKNELSSRMKDYAMLLENESIRCVSGEESEEIRKFFTENLAALKEIKGTIACKGKVRGEAKVVLTGEDYKKINEGNILIASMTTPNMIPIMKKASAFVTDEGGITCHAAIISREMKKPCVIGTKIATKIFKDGDLIEVNANNGTIKLIK